MHKVKTIYVVFKTHFDIGFTGLPSEVIELYRGDMLKSVIETCKATSSKEKGRRYIWTMPSWPFKKSIETCDDEIRKEALQLVKEGAIVWHALPFTTHTDFSGVEEFIRGLGISVKLDRLFGRYTIAAKMTDVPGHTRMLPSILAKAGIKFLHLGCNACANPPEVPRCFFWKGPDGNGVVTFYAKGGYGSDILPPDDWNYPVWLALMNTADNEGPHSSDFINGIIANVAEKLPGTRVVVGTLDDFARAFLGCDPCLPVVEADLADSWIHGIGTYPKEVSQVRRLRKEVMNVEGSLSLKELLDGYKAEDFVQYELASAYENILLFDEHTWGLDTKITLLPKHNGTRVYDKKAFLEEKDSSEYRRIEASWAEKSMYVVKAQESVRRIFKNLDREDGRDIAVYNMLPWKRGGEVDVTGIATQGDALVDGEGGMYPVCCRSGRNVAYVENLPPLGYALYSVEKAELCPSVTIAAADKCGGAVLENERILIKIDGKSGCITSFQDKINGKEWVAPGRIFGGYSYTIHGKERIIKYLKDYAYDLEAWYLADNGRPGYPWIEDKAYQAECCYIEINNTGDTGKVTVTWKMPEESVSLYGNAPEVVMEVLLAKQWDFADIIYRINGKAETPFAESGHFIFALNAKAPQYTLQKMGAALDPVKDIQYGANTSIYCCDRWMNVSDGESGLAFFPKDTPLLSIGENRIFAYSKDYKPEKPVLYWNAFNNQWGTNFPQWIGGSFEYQFRLLPYAGSWKSSKVPEKAEEYAVPLYPVKVENGASSNGKRTGCLLVSNIENANVLCLKKADNNNGFILRLQENMGIEGELCICIADGLGIYSRCNLREEDEEIYQEPCKEITVKTAPFEIHTFRIVKEES